MTKKKSHIIRFEDVRDQIVTIRGQQVIFDFAVAELYGVETREINQAVKNNPQKFPAGWIFELRKEELDNLRSKISTAKVAENHEDTSLRSNLLTAKLPSPKSRVLPRANETETEIELNFAVLKLKHTIKRKKQ